MVVYKRVERSNDDGNITKRMRKVTVKRSRFFCARERRRRNSKEAVHPCFLKIFVVVVLSNLRSGENNHTNYDRHILLLLLLLERLTSGSGRWTFDNIQQKIEHNNNNNDNLNIERNHHVSRFHFCS